MREITTRDDDDESKDAIPLHSGLSSHFSVRRASSSLTALHFFRRIISDMMFQKVENFQLEQTESFDFQRVTRRRHFSISREKKNATG